MRAFVLGCVKVLPGDAGIAEVFDRVARNLPITPHDGPAHILLLSISCLWMLREAAEGMPPATYREPSSLRADRAPLRSTVLPVRLTVVSVPSPLLHSPVGVPLLP